MKYMNEACCALILVCAVAANGQDHAAVDSPLTTRSPYGPYPSPTIQPANKSPSYGPPSSQRRYLPVTPYAPPAVFVARLFDGDVENSIMSRRQYSTPATEAAGMLWRMGPRVLPALRAGLKLDNVQLRMNIVYIARRFDAPDAMELILAACDDAAPTVRARAVSYLDVRTDERTYQIVFNALNDSDTYVRRAAAGVFGEYAEYRAAGGRLPPHVSETEMTNRIAGLFTESETCFAASYVLIQLKDSGHERELLAALDNDNGNLRSGARQAIFNALAKLGNRATAMALVKYLQNATYGDGAEAARALGQLKEPRTVPALVQALSNRDAWVRGAAALALGKIGDRRAVPRLIKLLEDAEWGTRYSAAEALAMLGDPAAVEPLIELMKGKDREATAAALALGKLGDARAIEPLKDYLVRASDVDSREVARALASIRYPRAIEALVEVVKDETAPKMSRLHADAALTELLGGHPGFSPIPRNFDKWWNENRDIYLQTFEAGSE